LLLLPQWRSALPKPVPIDLSFRWVRDFTHHPRPEPLAGQPKRDTSLSLIALFYGEKKNSLTALHTSTAAVHLFADYYISDPVQVRVGMAAKLSYLWVLFQ
jgi:hypothetical protein